MHATSERVKSYAMKRAGEKYGSDADVAQR